MKISTIWYWVSDLESMTAFYRDILGFQLKRLDEAGGWAELISDTGGLTVGLNRVDDEDELETGIGAVMTFEVADLDGFRKKLVDSGVDVTEIETVPGDVTLFNFWDPEGNPFQAMKPR